MELTTILNRCDRFRGFVYQHAHFSADKKSIEVAVRPRKGFIMVGTVKALDLAGVQLVARVVMEGIAPVAASFACLTVAWGCVAIGTKRIDPARTVGEAIRIKPANPVLLPTPLPHAMGGRSRLQGASSLFAGNAGEQSAIESL
jgi:hypothetical protein